MGLSFFHIIYIVKFNQGPIEAIASSVEIAEESWLKVTIMATLFVLIWFGINWLVNTVLAWIFYPLPVGEVIVKALLLIVYMYNYTIIVTAWWQLNKTR